METIAVVFDITSPYTGEEHESSIKPLHSIIKSLIEKKLYSESKDEISLIYCGSTETKNPLNEANGGYNNIEIKRELGRVNWELLEDFVKPFDYSFNKECDLLESITVAADHLVNHTRGRKNAGRKRIIILSNLEGEIDWSNLEAIIGGLKAEEIEVDVISRRELPEEDKEKDAQEDNENNFHGGYKLPPVVLLNENMLLRLVTDTEGASYSFEDALIALNYFTLKSTLQRGWKVDLEVSDVFTIPLSGYMKVKEAKAPSMKLVYGGDPEAEIEVKTTLYLNNEENTEVEPDQTIKGFKFGKSVIPCTEEDLASMKLSVEKSLKLIGFCEEQNVSPELYIGDSSMFFVSEYGESDRALTALVHALFELGALAIVRRVYSRASAPRLAILAPRIKDDVAVLVYREVAFGEDIRHYTFPKLPGPAKLEQDAVSSSSNDRNVLNEEELSLVDSMIDGMLLVEKTEETDNNPSTSKTKQKELYRPSRIVNPSIQLLFQSISKRHLNPQDPLPELGPDIMSHFDPPSTSTQNLQNSEAGDLFTRILDKFQLKIKESALAKLAKKKIASEMFPEFESGNKRRKLDDDDEEDMNSSEQNGVSEPSIIDLNTLFSNATMEITEVGSVNPIEDFRSLLERQELLFAMDSMCKRIWQLIKDSYLSTLYERALECIREMRQQAIEYSRTMNVDLVSEFNTFLKSMRDSLMAGGSGDNLIAKKDFWNVVLKDGTSLISKSESEYGVEDNEKEEFLTKKVEPEAAVKAEDNEMDDLFDDM